MADIELVIKISEGLKKDFELEQWTALSCMEMKDALMNGTPLPKGHGRLIDADDFLTLFRDGTEGYDCATYTRYDIGEILEKDAPTIIEADKESGK